MVSNSIHWMVVSQCTKCWNFIKRFKKYFRYFYSWDRIDLQNVQFDRPFSQCSLLQIQTIHDECSQYFKGKNGECFPSCWAVGEKWGTFVEWLGEEETDRPGDTVKQWKQWGNDGRVGMRLEHGGMKHRWGTKQFESDIIRQLVF